MLIAPLCREAALPVLTHVLGHLEKRGKWHIYSLSANTVPAAKLFLQQGESSWLQTPPRMPDRGKWERMSKLAVDKQWDGSKMRRIGLSNILHKCFSQFLMKKEKGKKKNSTNPTKIFWSTRVTICKRFKSRNISASGGEEKTVYVCIIHVIKAFSF